jgi:FkbM family methyltransferase
MSTPAELLDALLDNSEQTYQHSMRKQPRIVLYGAGNLGRSVLKRLRSADVDPIAFADDTLSKQGKTIDGLQVYPPEEIARRFGSDLTFVVTILNPALRFLDAKENLRRRTGCDAISLFDLGRMFPDALLPYLQYDTPGHVLKSSDDIRRAFDVFADEESRRQFVAHVEFRLTANYQKLPAKSQPAYFPADLIPELPADCVFVDCGAYDGDTIRQFLSHQSGRFGKVVAFEPDRQNYENLSTYVQSLEADVSSRIQLYHGAVGDSSGEIAFNETGDMSAAVSADGRGKVALFAIDDVLSSNGATTYIKLDVEGFEPQALTGAHRILKAERPFLAVSVYHRPEDLWRIPLSLHDLNHGYSLGLRTEGDDGMDVVCYAIPTPSARPTLA